MSLAMTRQEREGFLAGVHVGIISIPEDGRGPLTVPVWYTYEPGKELHVTTGRTSRKGRGSDRRHRAGGSRARSPAARAPVSGGGSRRPLHGEHAERPRIPRQRARSHAPGALVDRGLR